MVIAAFKERYRFLSNFWPLSNGVVFERICYATVEHAYQAAKTLDLEQRRKIQYAATPGKAKWLGKRVTLRPDWDVVKLDIMYQLCKKKFEQDVQLKRMLLATGSEELIEGNTWNDTFWGICRGKGKNHLGVILMRIRNELRPNA